MNSPLVHRPRGISPPYGGEIAVPPPPMRRRTQISSYSGVQRLLLTLKLTTFDAQNKGVNYSFPSPKEIYILKPPTHRTPNRPDAGAVRSIWHSSWLGPVCRAFPFSSLVLLPYHLSPGTLSPLVLTFHSPLFECRCPWIPRVPGRLRRGLPTVVRVNFRLRCSNPDTVVPGCAHRRIVFVRVAHMISIGCVRQRGHIRCLQG